MSTFTGTLPALVTPFRGGKVDVVALQEIFDPAECAAIPVELWGKREAAEVFHEILEHRWYLSEQAGTEVDIHETARDYIERFLTTKPDEAITGEE